MATGDRNDPCLGFNFTVEIDSLQAGGFSEVSGLHSEIEVYEFREGGVNDRVHKRSGPVKFSSNLILKHGITDSTLLWSWYCDVMQGPVKGKRKTVVVKLMDSSGEEERRWTFKNAYPVKWVGPDMRASASEVAVETLELAFEEMEK